MTALGTGPGEPPGGSTGIAGAVLFGAVSVVLIAVAPYPPDTPRVRPAAAPSFESVPPAAAPEAGCDACDRICERCRELCRRDGAANWDWILERPPASAPERVMSAPRICYECKREYGRIKGTSGLASHGVCPECLRAFRRRMYEVTVESSAEAVVEIGECPTCGGPLRRLGDPGRGSRFRCRNCGVDSSRKEG
jgi:hypothetical protein